MASQTSLSNAQQCSESLQNSSSSASSERPVTPSQSNQVQENSTTDTILLNPSAIDQDSSHNLGEAPRSTPATVLIGQNPAEERRCWICFSDETEDTPSSSCWRSPCPCALTAHESCILDWVADIEGTNNGVWKKVLCPQCKSEIRIARPRSLVVDAMKGLERAAGRMVLPTVVMMGSSTIVYLSLSYGAMAVHLILGHNDFHRIFSQEMQNPTQIVRRLFGLSILPWMLILSRTSIADSLLPIVPMFFFVTQSRPDPLVDFTSWPPSAGLSFALLPYIRAVYYTYFDLVWGQRLRQWIEQVKPRSSTTQMSDDNGPRLEIELAGDDEDEDEDEDEEENESSDDGDGDAHERNAAPPPPPIARAPGGEPAEAPAGPGPELAPAPVLPAPGPPRNNRQDYNISISELTRTVLGALVFPGISAIAGDLLRVALPSSWTTLSSKHIAPTRFLQTRWGRSLVGGCIFVALKDAITLYVSWKMAMNHQKRRILDYNKSKGRKNDTT